MKCEFDSAEWDIWHEWNEYTHVLSKSNEKESRHENTEKVNRDFVGESLDPPSWEDEPEQVHQEWGLRQAYQENQEVDEPEHVSCEMTS